MIELVFIACLAASPASCREQSLIYSDVPLRLCLMRAQVEMAQWVGDHPGWRIDGWTCHELGARGKTT